jgi:hypothetical protein
MRIYLCSGGSTFSGGGGWGWARREYLILGCLSSGS